MQANILVAGPEDLPRIETLVNSAYRGEKAKQGWTHEADLIEGSQRIDKASLKAALEKDHTTLLKYERAGSIEGCVYLEQKGTTLYLGMLTVDPALQAKGTGKQLLLAAEKHGRSLQCARIEMTVVSGRMELIEWYNRRGYKATGETRPFHNDGRFGVPREKIHFVVMEKWL